MIFAQVPTVRRHCHKLLVVETENGRVQVDFLNQNLSSNRWTKRMLVSRSRVMYDLGGWSLEEEQVVDSDHRSW